MKIACVIPARLQSIRFPRKMLSFLGGKPLLQWVWEAAMRTSLFDTVCFAVDSPEIGRLVESFNGKYYLTSEECPSGTHRLIELQQKGLVEADIWVNWQGDEPFIHTAMIEDLLQSCQTEHATDVWTLKKEITNPEQISSIHTAKIVCDAHGFALYFSRSPIPCYRDAPPLAQQQHYKHVGLYAFTTEALKKITSLPASPLEEAEKLEQLRFLYHGLRIRVHETQHEVFGIDLPEQLAAAQELVIKNFSSCCPYV